MKNWRIGQIKMDLLLGVGKRFFTELQSFFAIINCDVARSVTREYAQFVTERLRTCLQALSALCEQLESDQDLDISEMHSNLRDLKKCCLSLHVVWSYRLDLLDSTLTDTPQLLSQAQNFTAPFSPAEGRGRPHHVITQEQLEYLRAMKFSWTQISRLLGVSRMTVYRRRRDLGILQSDDGSSISDSSLSSLLQHIRREMPK